MIKQSIDTLLIEAAKQGMYSFYLKSVPRKGLSNIKLDTYDYTHTILKSTRNTIMLKRIRKLYKKDKIKMVLKEYGYDWYNIIFKW